MNFDNAVGDTFFFFKLRPQLLKGSGFGDITVAPHNSSSDISSSFQQAPKAPAEEQQFKRDGVVGVQQMFPLIVVK